MNKCSNCLYCLWRGRHYCHRNPPQVIREDGSDWSTWPPVNGDWWCGEYQPSLADWQPDGNEPPLCPICGRPENDPKHVKYGPDLDNPVKHEFEAVVPPAPPSTGSYTAPCGGGLFPLAGDHPGGAE